MCQSLISNQVLRKQRTPRSINSKPTSNFDVLKKCFATVYATHIFWKCSIWVILGRFGIILGDNYALIMQQSIDYAWLCSPWTPKIFYSYIMYTKNAFQRYMPCLYSKNVQFGSFWVIFRVFWGLIMHKLCN